MRIFAEDLNTVSFFLVFLFYYLVQGVIIQLAVIFIYVKIWNVLQYL